MPHSEVFGKLISFSEAISNIAVLDGKKSLLIGNGFSMAYDVERFSFTNLLETAIDKGLIAKDSEILKVFRRLNTADFEKVIRYLDQTCLVADIYFPDADKKKIKEDIKKLKKHLVNTITNNHPDKSTDLDVARSQKCAEFFNNFNRIYSLNYDLLAYWVILQNRLMNFTDGYGDPEVEPGEDVISNDYVVYQDTQHELLFLHGGLHLFDNKTETIKLTFCRTNETLKKQIYLNLLADRYPVFVSEGTSKDKLEKIKHNYYLNHCYKALKNQPGSLLIYGTALKSNDEHIKKALIESKFTNIFIGVYAENELQQIGMFKDKIEARNQKLSKKAQKTVTLYNASTVAPWGTAESPDANIAAKIAQSLSQVAAMEIA